MSDTEWQPQPVVDVVAMPGQVVLISWVDARGCVQFTTAHTPPVAGVPDEGDTSPCVES